MKTIIGILLVLFAVAAVLPALVALAGQGSAGDELVIGATAVPQATQDHDLAMASFEKLFTISVISGDTVSFSFEIVNQGRLQDTAAWRLASDNATADTADDITVASGDALLASGFSLRTGPGGISWDTSGARTGDHTVTLSVDPVPGESDTANNSRSVTVRLIERPLDPTGSPLVLKNPGIATEVQPLTARFLENQDAVFQSGLADPAISTEPQPISGTFIVNQDAVFGPGMVLQDPNLTTLAQPLTSSFIENQDATFQSGLTNIAIPVEAQGLTSIFINSHDAVFGPGILLENPFTGVPGLVTIRSASVHLQGRADSSGAFLRVNGQDNFVDSNGSFNFTVAPGTHKIQIQAPGYLTVDVVSFTDSDIALNAGDVLFIPELTMVYGDANGDGTIDVRDLAVGASNFGLSEGQIKAAPQ